MGDESADGNLPEPDTADLVRLANARMPYGRYAGSLLIDLPEAYLVWFARQGWPQGQLGRLLASLYVVKENGMEQLLRPLVEGSPVRPGPFREGRD